MDLAKGTFMEVMLRGGRALAKGTSACWHLVARVAFLGVPSTVVSTGTALIDSLEVRVRSMLLYRRLVRWTMRFIGGWEEAMR